MNWQVKALLCISICLAGAVSPFAQGSGTATVTATVVDNVGIVPGAVATITELATGTVRTTVSNELGVLRAGGLPPGRYSLKIQVPGFKPITVENFQLTSAEIRDLGTMALSAGGVTEAVTVSAAVTPVQVTTGVRQASITSDQLTNIQMKGRDIYGLLATVAGVQDTNLNRDFTMWSSMAGVTINGAGTSNKNVTVDGISIVDEGGTNATVNPNIDAIGEVQVITSGYTAENGRNNGGLVNFVTKSGTSTFKGSGWYNARRDAWNSNDYVRIRNGTPKPLYRVNIGGFGIGGPVIIPKLFDSRTAKRKVFFFFSQEYTDDARPTESTTINFPTAAERIGDFSDTRVTNGSIQQIIDPQTGQQFPGNIIPASRINPIGQKLLNLFPLPNGYVNPAAGQQYTANFIFDQTPLHERTDHVFRADAVLTDNIRFSAKFLADHEASTFFGQTTPGVGTNVNRVPGWLASSTVTWVLSPTLVNETNGGFAINHFGFRMADDQDYHAYYCVNAGVCAPRIQPFKTYAEPQQWGKHQVDQYPYVAQTSYSGGNRANLAAWTSGSRPGTQKMLPSSNLNARWVFQDDLSKTRGRHSLKFGTYIEWSSKTEPASSDYMGNFSFGSVATNPNDSGNGYANGLLGNFQTYTEVTDRVDKDVRHWQVDGYAQDSWRLNSKFTLDYGVRFTHTDQIYEVNQMTSAFYPELYNIAAAPRLYRAACSNGAAGNVACPSANRRAIDPANPGQFLSFALVGSFVPGSGDELNGMQPGTFGKTGKGDYSTLPPLVAAPRVGFAWDVRGDGKSAVRGSAGVFYNALRAGGASFIGNPPVSFTNIVRNASIDDIANFASGNVPFSRGPFNTDIATLDRLRFRLPIAYQANFAYQRDIGFRTVVEAAYVGNFQRHEVRSQNLEVLPLFVFANPANQFNQTAISPNFLKTLYPGLGTVTTPVYDQTALSYHALQLSVNRRLSQGLQMGLAYTLAHGYGMVGYDNYTVDPTLTIANVGGTRAGGADALRARYWGPTTNDRTHNLSLNYSYTFPNPAKNTRILKWVLADWQVSGVTKFLSGTAVNPTCSSNNTGIKNSDPTYTGVGARCMLTGAPVNAGVRVDPDPANPDPLAAKYYNTAAFAMAQPISATEGNFGNAPLGLLRNPSYSSWDLTLARRIPVRVSKNGAVRVQLQAYNLFNQVKFTTLSAGMQFTGANNATLNSAAAGTYSNVIAPRQLGLTVRLDF